jgi:hypothetical protein
VSRVAWTIDAPPPHIAAFVRWWVDDRKYGEREREYAAQAELAVQTVRNWMQDPRVRQLVGVALEESNASAPKVQEVLDMLHRRATQEDDVKAAGLYLTAVGKMVPRRELNVTIHDARELSNDQLHAELRRAIALMEGRPALPEVIEEAEVLEDVAV